MDNIELEKKVLELTQETNYFEMVLKLKEFEKEYKTTEFYKITKKPLMDVVREMKLFYALQFKDLGAYLQKMIDGLSLDNLNTLLDKISEVFAKENSEINESLEVFKNLEK